MMGNTTHSWKKLMRMIVLILILISLHVSGEAIFKTDELKASLIASCSSIPKNGEFSAGVLFELKPDWHLYWINPGDTGLPPTIQWHRPKSISASDILWAFPHKFEIEGITNLGYENQLLLPVTMKSHEVQQKQVELVANTSWLVCKDICIPGKAELKKKFSIADSCLANAEQSLFTDWQNYIPIDVELLDGSAAVSNNKLAIEIYFKKPIFRDAKSVDLYLENHQIVSYQETQTQRWKNNWISWTQDLNDSFTKLPPILNTVIVVDHKRSYRVTLSTLEEK